MRPSLLALCLGAALPLAGCKPSSTKAPLGPFNANRYEMTSTDGKKQFCYVFGADTNQPARLCGEASITPDHNGVLFAAEAPFENSEFVSKIGPALDAGYYLLKPIGSQRVDAWSIGKPAMREWIGGGKRLLTIESDESHVTKVRVIDFAARADRDFEIKTQSSEFLLVRADEDASLLFVQKNGGNELLLLENPVANPVLTVCDVSEQKTAGTRKMYKEGELDRRESGKLWRPQTGFFGHITWQGTKPLYDNAPLGPWEEPRQ